MTKMFVGILLIGIAAAQGAFAQTCPSQSCPGGVVLPPLPSAPPNQCGPYIDGLPPAEEGDPWFDGTFVMGVSYFSAIAAPLGEAQADLDWLENRGFNHVRVMATWNRDWSNGNPGSQDPVPNACLIDSSGDVIPGRLADLTDFLDAATVRGFTADVSFWYRDYKDEGCNLQSCGNDAACWPKYHDGVIEFINDIEGQYPNVFVDIANEAYTQNPLNWTRLEGLRDAARIADPDRLLTFSQADLNEGTSGTDPNFGFNRVPGLDFVTPHFTRSEFWDDETVERVDHLRAILDDLRPIHLQEESRVGWCNGSTGPPSPECEHDDLLNSLGRSVYAGAAGWNFHTDAAYDLDQNRLRNELGGTGSEECKVALCVGDVLTAALAQQADAGCVPGQVDPPVASVAPVRDTFGGANDDSLDGTITEVGDLAWEVTSNAEITRIASEKRIRASLANESPKGGVSYEPSTDGSTTILTGDLQPSSDPSNPWVGLGFAEAPTSAFWNNGRFWLALRNSGMFTVRDNATEMNSVLATGTAPTFFPGALNRVELEYDRAANAGRVTINDVEVMPRQELTALDPSEMQAVSTQLFSASLTDARVDNVEVCEISTELKDAFLTDGDLNNVEMTIGGAVWRTARPRSCSSSEPLEIVGSRVVTNCPAQPAAGVVPFDGAASDQIASVVADVTFGESLSFGFSRIATPSYFGTEDQYFERFGELWAEVGNRIVVFEGTTLILAINFPIHMTGTHRFRLSYDPVAQSAGLWVDDFPMAPRMPLSGPLDIRGVGLELLGSGFFGSVEVDTFEARREAAVARDGFEGSKGLGADMLDGRTTAFGDRVWEAVNADVVNDRVVRSGSGSGYGTVPLPEAATNNVMEVSATIGEGTANWTAIGFTDAPAGLFWNAGQAWIVVRPTSWEAHVGPSGGPVATGTLSGATPHHVRLRYDPLANTVSVILDEVTVLDAFEIDGMGSPPNLNVTDAGLHIIDGGDGFIDDFEVRLDCQR